LVRSKLKTVALYPQSVLFVAILAISGCTKEKESQKIYHLSLWIT